ncbi:hypothetical protein D3C85_1036690 [compost metagenome]
MRHHCVGIAQFDGHRQVGHGHALDRQRGRRTGDRTGEDEHAVARLDLGFEVRGQIDTDLEQRRGLGRRCLCNLAATGHQLFRGPGNSALQRLAGLVLRRQLRQQAIPVIDGVLITLAFKRGNAQQAKAGDFFRIGLERFVGQGLDLVRPLLAIGEVLGLGPLTEQLGLTTGQVHRALEHLRRIRRAVLSHVGATEEVHAFSGIRLSGDRTLQALGHLFHRLGSLGEFAGQFDLVAGTEMQIQAQAQHRHQNGRQQRQGFAQTRHPRRFSAFGVRQQFTGGFGATGVHLRRIEHALFLLSLQLSHALLIQRDVQGGTILFALGATAAQHRDQQKTQGNQKQQTCSEPEINHSWFYPTGGRGASAPRQKASPGCRRVARDDGGRSPR